MSDNIPSRVFRLGKAYLNKVRDRVDSELSDAERELQDEADRPLPGGGTRPAREDASPDAAFTRAQQKIRAAQARIDAHGESGAERVAEASSGGGTASQNAAAPPDPNTSDFRVLGIAPDAGWDDVLSAYEKITRRCDPRRFPDGSAEQKEAGRILERVNTAYDNLRKRLDPTESRFARLEFDAGSAAPSGPSAADTPAAAPNVPPELN